MGTPIHDMTKLEHEHRWTMGARYIENKIRAGVTSTTVQKVIRCECGETRDVQRLPEPSVRLSEDEFEVRFQPDNNDGSYYSWLAVRALDQHYVWSIIEIPDDPKGNLYAVPGFYHVNLIDYVISATPWTDDIVEAVYMDREKNFGKAENK